MSRVWRPAVLALLFAGALAAEQHPNAVKGFDPNGVYQMNGLDTVSAFNGNLNVSIPIGHAYPLGGGVSFQLRLYGNSNIWDTEARKDLADELEPMDLIACGDTRVGEPGPVIPCVHAYPDRRANAGMGWTLSLGRLYPPFDQSNDGPKWIYESPDGAEHMFFDRVHLGVDDGAPLTYYTKDGTYLRLTQDNAAGTMVLEFPNGEIHTFDSWNGAPGVDTVLGPLQVRSIGNRHSRELLTVNYAADTIQFNQQTRQRLTWTITDGHRSHKVVLLEHWFESGLADDTLLQVDPTKVDRRMLVDSVTLSGFRGANATWQFAYRNAWDAPTFLPRPDWHTIPDWDTNLQAAVQLLDSVRLPDGTAFAFQYATAWPDNGLLSKMELPTGGSVEWKYGEYQFPTTDNHHVRHQSRTRGVATRTEYDPVTQKSAVWTYEIALDKLWDSISDKPTESRTKITDPLLNVSEHYFDVSSLKDNAVRYGLPYAPKRTKGSLFLSSKSIPAGQIGTRSTWVLYEHDPGDKEAPGDKCNVRQTESLAEAEDPATDGTTVHTKSTLYDGLGHYRTVETLVGGQLAKKVKTNYNPSSGVYPGSFVPIPATSPWVTETYDSVEVTQGTTTQLTQFCFDAATGFLTGKRTVRGGDVPRANDLLAVFTATAKGDVATESFYGGDGQPLASTSGCTAAASDVAVVRLANTYAAGTLAKSVYLDAGVSALDLTIDPSSGLPLSSRDVSGIATTFSYDAFGRLTEIRPTGAAWTEIAYPSSGSAPPLAVTATQRSASTSAVLAQSVYHYDGFGRVIQESRRIPDGWSRTSSTFDLLGRRTKAWVPVAAQSSSFVAPSAGAFTATTYDGFGRVTLVEQPDGARTEVAYTKRNASGSFVPSSRIKRTTSLVWTGSGDTSVVTEEETDGLGRLIRVTEDAGGALEADTNYAYDAGDRLISVQMGVQTRTFVYDHAGLLRRETHPESKTTSYTYDARGHVLTRVTPVATLRHEYDAAERLLKVFDGALLLKEFVYNPSGSAAAGRLASAARYNRYDVTTAPGSAKNTVKVEESFVYDAAGRIATKTTDVTPGERFEESYVYDELGAVSELTYPKCAGCPGLTAPDRTVKTTRTFGLTTAVPNYASRIAYHPNGLLQAIQHVNFDNTAGPLYEQTADSSMPRPAKISLSNVCSGLTITEHPKSQTVIAGTQVTLTAAATGNTTWEWYERTAAGDGSVIATTASHKVTASIAPKTYFARARNGSCSADTALAVVTGISSCGVDATITAPASISPGTTHSASVPATAGATYLWTATNGTIVGSNAGPGVNFTATCARSVTLKVTVTVASCATPNEREVVVAMPTAHVSGSATISGGSAELSVAFTGSGTWEAIWSDGVREQYSGSSATRHVSPSVTTSYAIEKIVVGGCEITNNGSIATITVAPACDDPAPGASVEISVGTVIASTKVSAKVVNKPAGADWTVEWTVGGNGRFLSINGTQLWFEPFCTGSVTLTAKITSACGATRTITRTVPIEPMTLRIRTASLTYIPGGEPVTIEADVTNTSIPTVTWSDGLTERPLIVDSGVYKRTVAPAATAFFTMTKATNRGGCDAQVLGEALVTVCPIPDATITAPAAVNTIEIRRASVAEAPNAQYLWTIEGGTILGSDTDPSILFQSTSCTGQVKLTARVFRTCGTSDTKTVTVPVVAWTATVTGSATIAQGSSANIQATLTGVMPWRVKWSDQPELETSTSPLTRTVTPNATTTYTLESVRDANGCALTLNGSAVITVVPPAPVAVSAAALSPSQIRVSWVMPGSADEFEVWRNGVRIPGAVASSPFVDTVTASTAHVYHVVAVKGGTRSAPSTRDLATAVVFSGDPLLPEASDVEAAHILQLRTAVNAVRALSGLGDFAFTDPSLANVDQKAVHVTELRTALDAARMRLGLPPTVSSRPALAPGDLIAATDISDIRGGVR